MAAPADYIYVNALKEVMLNVIAVATIARTAVQILAAMWLCTAAVTAALAANFESARYDQEADELVVTLTYRGTNPDHTFSIEWGSCETDRAAGSFRIAARVVDGQWNDLARELFTRTVRFSLRDLRCRPATVTLFTAPQFTVDVTIPARGDADRSLRGPRTDAH